MKNQLKQIALYGGAFDPPHRAHIEIAKNLTKLPFVDEVWLLPCGDREDKKLLLSKDTRFKLMR
jgi:nicotinate-nucleotide adenylyltransferase